MSKYDFTRPKYRQGSVSPTKIRTPRTKKTLSQRIKSVPRTNRNLSHLKPQEAASIRAKTSIRRTAAIARIRQQMQEERARLDRRRERFEIQQAEQQKAMIEERKALIDERKTLALQEERLTEMELQSRRSEAYDQDMARHHSDIRHESALQRLYFAPRSRTNNGGESVIDDGGRIPMDVDEDDDDNGATQEFVGDPEVDSDLESWGDDDE